jgi:hypothetical protein
MKKKDIFLFNQIISFEVNFVILVLIVLVTVPLTEKKVALSLTNRRALLLFRAFPSSK